MLSKIFKLLFEKEKFMLVTTAASSRKPAEQPDGLGWGRWRGWWSSGGQQSHRAGLSLQPKTRSANEHKKEDHHASRRHLENRNGAMLWSVFLELCCFEKLHPTHPVQNQKKCQAAKTSLSALPGLTSPKCNVELSYCFILMIHFLSLGLFAFCPGFLILKQELPSPCENLLPGDGKGSSLPAERIFISLLLMTSS